MNNEQPPEFLVYIMAFGIIGSIYGIIALIGLILNV
jgi:hypothetical protein